MNAETLTLDEVRIDWLTMTTWSLPAWESWIHEERYVNQTRERYRGRRNLDDTIWVGDGRQRNAALGQMVNHRMLQISGNDAHLNYERVRDYEPDWETHEAAWENTCTRIDIQITTEWSNANLFEMLARWRGKGRKGNFYESNGGMTIYLGAWGSERFARIYQKGDDLVRFEMCYKKAYASPIYHQLYGLDGAQRKALMTFWLAAEVLRINDRELTAVFEPVLKVVGQKPPREKRRPTTDTERWFRRVVMPALAKYINSHDVDEGLLGAMIELIVKERENDNSEL